MRVAISVWAHTPPGSGILKQWVPCGTISTRAERWRRSRCPRNTTSTPCCPPGCRPRKNFHPPAHALGRFLNFYRNPQIKTHIYIVVQVSWLVAVQVCLRYTAPLIVQQNSGGVRSGAARSGLQASALPLAFPILWYGWLGPGPEVILFCIFTSLITFPRHQTKKSSDMNTEQTAAPMATFCCTFCLPTLQHALPYRALVLGPGCLAKSTRSELEDAFKEHVL